MLCVGPRNQLISAAVSVAYMADLRRNQSGPIGAPRGLGLTEAPRANGQLPLAVHRTDWSAENDRPTSVGGPPHRLERRERSANFRWRSTAPIGAPRGLGLTEVPRTIGQVPLAVHRTDWSAEGTRLDRSTENDRPSSVGGPPHRLERREQSANFRWRSTAPIGAPRGLGLIEAPRAIGQVPLAVHRTDWSAEGTRLDRSTENDRPTSIRDPPVQKFFDHRLRFILITSLSSLY
jgi:hypothetical protein